MTSREPSQVVGLRVPMKTMVELARGAGVDPDKIRPALRVVRRGGQEWRVRCWVLVDASEEICATADAGVTKQGRGPAALKFITGKLMHFYVLE